MNEPLSQSVLVVDDDGTFTQRLNRELSRKGFEVRVARDGPTAIELGLEESPEWAVVNLRMPGAWGQRVVSELLSADPSTQVIVLTAYGHIASALDAVKLGACDYLQKPVTAAEILAVMERVLIRDGGTPGAPPSREEVQRFRHALEISSGDHRRAAKMVGVHWRALRRVLGDAEDVSR